MFLPSSLSIGSLLLLSSIVIVLKYVLKSACKAFTSLDNNSIDCIVTDPPYAIKFMSKSWDSVLPSIKFWKECLRVLKAGSFGFIMCTPRQDCLSRMVVNLEDAGFNTGFTSIYWTYASGFPKAMNIGKQVDKKAGKYLGQEFCSLIKRLTALQNRVNLSQLSSKSTPLAP